MDGGVMKSSPLSAERPCPARARPCARAIGPAGRRNAGVAGGRASSAGLALGRQSPGSASSRQPAGPAAVRAELLPNHEFDPGPPTAWRRLPAGFAAGLRRTGVRRGGEGRSEQPRGADRGGPRPLRQGPARPCFLASRTARPPFPQGADRSVPSRATLDLLWGYASCSSRTGPRPGARPTDTAWKEGRNAS